MMVRTKRFSIDSTRGTTEDTVKKVFGTFFAKLKIRASVAVIRRRYNRRKIARGLK
jgi:hypothetical protein